MLLSGRLIHDQDSTMLRNVKHLNGSRINASDDHIVRVEEL